MERGEDGGGVVGDVVADMMLAAERGFLPSFLRQASLQYSKELEGVVICFSHMALQESNESVDRVDSERMSEGLPVLQKTSGHGFVLLTCFQDYPLSSRRSE